MAWDDISDLWWLQPGKGDTADILLRGASAGATLAQRQDALRMNQEYRQDLIGQRQYSDFTDRMRVESAIKVQRSKEASDTIRAAGFGELNAHLAKVAAKGAWDDPLAEAEFWSIVGKYPQSIERNDVDKLYENTFVRARDYKAKQAQATSKAALDEERLIIARDRALAAKETAEAAMLRAQTYASESEPTVLEKEGHKFLKFRGTLRELRDVEEMVVDGERFIISPAGGVTRVRQGGGKVAEANKLRYQNEVKALHLDYTLGKLKDDKGQKITPEEFKKKLDAVAEKYLGGEAAPTAPPTAAAPVATTPLASPPPPPTPAAGRIGLTNTPLGLAEPPAGVISTNKPLEFDYDPATGQLVPRR